MKGFFSNEIPVLRVDSKFGVVQIQSTKLTKELINEYEIKYHKAQSLEEFNQITKELNAKLNTPFGDIRESMEEMFFKFEKNILGLDPFERPFSQFPLKEFLSLPLKKVTEEDIDKMIEKLQIYKNEIIKQNEEVKKKERKEDLEKKIKLVQDKINQKNIYLMQNLQNQELVNQLIAELRTLQDELKSLEELYKKLDI